MAEHAVDLLQIDDPGLVADRFNQRAEAEVFRAAQLALFGALATCESVGGEGVVADAGAVEFGEDERLDRVRGDGKTIPALCLPHESGG